MRPVADRFYSFSLQTGGSGYFDIFWGLVLGDFFAKMIKGKDLMIGMVRGQRGL